MEGHYVDQYGCVERRVQTRAHLLISCMEKYFR